MSDKASSGTESRNFDRLLYDTAKEAIAAWNTRAERTCENVMPRSYNYLECSLCGALTYQGKAEFNYCPNCRAKVVSK